MNATSDDVSHLTKQHYSLAQKVSGIEIKSDDTANQLMLTIENQYWAEYTTAIEIAKGAGYYRYHKLVLINPSLNIVRLGNISGEEISVNIDTQVITTYSPL